MRDGDGILFNADCDTPLDISADDIVKYQNGEVSADKSCKYLDLIIKIFQKTPEAQSIFISMPAAVMGFAIANVEFDARLIPESYIMLKDVKRLPYAAIGDYDLIADALTTSCPVTVIDNECIIALAKIRSKPLTDWKCAIIRRARCFLRSRRRISSLSMKSR